MDLNIRQIKPKDIKVGDHLYAEEMIVEVISSPRISDRDGDWVCEATHIKGRFIGETADELTLGSDDDLNDVITKVVRNDVSASKYVKKFSFDGVN